MVTAEQIKVQASSVRSRLLLLQRGLIQRALADREEGRDLDWEALFREAFELSTALEQLAWIEAALAPSGKAGSSVPRPHNPVEGAPFTRRRRKPQAPDLEGRTRPSRSRRTPGAAAGRTCHALGV